MSEDYKRQHKNSLDIQIQCTLKSIKYFLESMRKNIENYDLPPIQDNSTDFVLSIKEIDEKRLLKLLLKIIMDHQN